MGSCVMISLFLCVLCINYSRILEQCFRLSQDFLRGTKMLFAPPPPPKKVLVPPRHSTYCNCFLLASLSHIVCSTPLHRHSSSPLPSPSPLSLSPPPFSRSLPPSLPLLPLFIFPVLSIFQYMLSQLGPECSV